MPKRLLIAAGEAAHSADPLPFGEQGLLDELVRRFGTPVTVFSP